MTCSDRLEKDMVSWQEGNFVWIRSELVSCSEDSAKKKVLRKNSLQTSFMSVADLF